MKELSIEEKAKEYDGNFEVYAELVNRLEEVKDAILKHNYGIAIDVLYKPYPVFKVITHSEFKESEDERIRKELIDGFKRFDCSIWYGIDIKRILAWLEKRGEQNPTDEEMKTILRTEYEKGRADAIAEFQQEWSKEDKTMLCYMEGHLEYLKNDKGYSSSEDQIMLKRQLDWLKSLKYRVQPQPQQEWTEEDEEMYKEVLTDIVYAKNDLEAKECLGLSKRAMEAFNWFSKRYKSLRPQNTWKPSKAQMDALDYYANSLCTYCDRQDDLRSLFNDLKKLRDE